MSQFLVNNPDAERFMQLAQTNAGSAAFLGDETKLDSGVGPDVVNAKIALRDSASKVAALVADPTRTEVAKHEAAQQLAEKTVAILTKTKAAIEARGNQLSNDGQDDARRAFVLNPERRFVHDRIMDHMLSVVGAPDGTGMMKLRELLNNDGEAAAVFANVKPYLLRMNAENFDKLHLEITERYAPAAFKKMTDSADLVTLAPRYEKAISSVRQSFFNPMIAAQASKRVQL